MWLQLRTAEIDCERKGCEFVKKCRITLLLIVFLLSVGFSVKAAQYWNYYSLSHIKTPEENVFAIDGSDEEFILLDITENRNAKYFVMSKKFYGKMAYDTTGDKKLNSSDDGNIAYYLNGKLLTEEGLLPEKIKEYIHREHVWKTRGEVGNAQITSYNFIGGVSLLSLDEFNQYLPVFGYRDDASGKWWLRDALKDGNNAYLLCVNAVEPGAETDKATVGWAVPTESREIRPVFYLNERFYKDVRLDLSRSGNRVRRMLAQMTSNELKAAGYTEEECAAILAGEQIAVNRAENTSNVYEPDEEKYTYTISLSKGSGKSYTLDYSVTDVYHEKVIPFEKIPVFVGVGSVKTERLPLESLPEGIYILSLKILCDDRIAYQYQNNFAVLESYQPQFMNEFTLREMCQQFPRAKTRDRQNSILKLLKDAGCTNVRTDYWLWSAIEKNKGVYDSTYFKDLNNAKEKFGINLLPILGKNNALYGNDVDTIISKRRNLEGFTDYINQVAKHAPYLTMVELYNEADYGGAYVNTFKSDYTNVEKFLYEKVKKENPNLEIMVGGIAQSWLIEPMEGMLRYGIYPYTDAFSIHGYNHPRSITYDFFGDRFKSQQDVISNYGGWKPLYITETGTTTAKNQSGVSENMSAREVVRAFILADMYNMQGMWYYQFLNTGIDMNNTEDCFGLVTWSLEAKPGYISYAVMNKNLSGAIYCGQVNIGENIFANIYNKDGNAIMVLWYNVEGETTSVHLDDKNIRVEDVMGSLKSAEPDFELGYEINYVKNINRSWINRAAYETTLAKIDNWHNQFDLTRYDTQIAALKEKASVLLKGEAEEVKAYVNEMFDLGDQILNDSEESALEDVKVSQILYEWYNAAEYTLALYASVETQQIQTFGIKELFEAEQTIDAAITAQGGHDMPYTRAIYAYARTALINAQRVMAIKEENPNKNGSISSFILTADRVSRWASQMSGIELCENTDLFIRVEGKNHTVYEGVENKILVDILNVGDRSFAGKFVLYNDDGQVNCETKSVSVGAQGNASAVLPFDSLSLSESGKYMVAYEDENGYAIRTQNLEIDVEKILEISLLAVSKTVDNLDKIEVKLTNTSSIASEGNLVVTPPEGWSVKSEAIEYRIGAKESQIYTLDIEKTTNIDYHHYSFTIKAVNSSGNIIKQVKQPLSFTCVVETENVDIDSFNGDISDWRDAYPIYINPVEDPDDFEQWKLATASTRVFAKWDKDNLYFLADVYDDALANVNSGGSMWNGDCLQIQVDTLNDKANKYLSDDLEIGFAYTPEGNACYVWHAVADKTAGSRSSSLVNIIRDNTLKSTRYLIRIPKDEMNYQEIKSGMKLGLNFAINDADVSVRLRYFEFTPGLASSKNPGFAYTFELVDGKEKTTPPKTNIFPIQIN